MTLVTQDWTKRLPGGGVKTVVQAVCEDVGEGMRELASLLMHEAPDFRQITNALIHLRYLTGVAEQAGVPPDVLDPPIDRVSRQLLSGHFDRAASARELERCAATIARGRFH